MLNYKIDFEKLSTILPNWSWQELRYGLNRKYITENDIVSYAMQILAEDITQYDLILELSIADGDEVEELLCRLIENEVQQNLDKIESKWVISIIYLAYTCERNHLYEIIDDVYTEFDYPEEIKNLIGYMPCEDGRSMDERVEEYIKGILDKQ